MLPRVCIFAKPPIAGQVKTRLAAALGSEAAAELACAFLDDTLAAVRALGWARVTVASTAPREGVETLLQGQGDLGARIERVLRAALADAPFAIAIGADAPALPRRLLEAARDALQRADAVLGPADDGGFYLLGVRRCPEGLLADLPWSRSDTFVRTLARLRERGLRTELIDPWFDVDRVEDLEQLRALIEGGAIDAPRTASVLEKFRRISVIIPVLDEERRIGALLAELRGRGFTEVIVVDGGSRDRTVEIARAACWGGPRVATAPRGRASQMNAGARLATGDVLLFLHADASLPAGAAGYVEGPGALRPARGVRACRGLPRPAAHGGPGALAAPAPAGADRHRARERARVGAALPCASDPRHAARQRIPAAVPSRRPASLARAPLPRRSMISLVRPMTQ